jgi:hydroxyacylglutathione hydrolase
MSTMAQSLDRLASLSPNTLVCCAHEYTLDNLHFALSIEPNNPKLQERVQKVVQRRKLGQATVPSLLKEELETNPFLRSQSQEVLTKLGLDSLSDRSLIFEKTRRLKDSKAYRETPLESLLKA